MSTVAQQGIEERVCKLVAEQFATAPASLKLGAQMAVEYGADDLDMLEITMSVEDEFGIEIEDDNMNAFKTVQDIVDHVTAEVGV
jgi:acyl carrier protein